VVIDHFGVIGWRQTQQFWQPRFGHFPKNAVPCSVRYGSLSHGVGTVLDGAVLKAYVAPNGTKAPLLYSVFVDDLDGGHEMSPALETMSEAVAWALERTDFVIARQATGPYFWYGRGRMPSDIEPPPT
jgi:hypothetical protein